MLQRILIICRLFNFASVAPSNQLGAILDSCHIPDQIRVSPPSSVILPLPAMTTTMSTTMSKIIATAITTTATTVATSFTLTQRMIAFILYIYYFLCVMKKYKLRAEDY